MRGPRVRCRLADPAQLGQHAPGPGSTKMTKSPRRCRPHRWRVPEVGGDALECEACGRRLRFREDMTPNVHATIQASIERRLAAALDPELLRRAVERSLPAGAGGSLSGKRSRRVAGVSREPARASMRAFMEGLDYEPKGRAPAPTRNGRLVTRIGFPPSTRIGFPRPPPPRTGRSGLPRFHNPGEGNPPCTSRRISRRTGRTGR